nr:hypothetical protein [uncultured Rhodopila sp.]
MTTRKLIFAAATAWLGLGCAPGVAAPTSWNAAGDFSTTANPNGQWSYGFLVVQAGALTNDFVLSTQTSSGVDPVTGVQQTGWVCDYCDIWKNAATVRAYGVGVGQIGLDSDYGDSSTIRWTAPSAAVYSISGSFGSSGSGTGPSGAGWEWGTGTRSVSIDGQQVWSETGDEWTPLGSQFSFNETLAAGATIDFTVWGNSGCCGNTEIDATISTVVEPSSAIMTLVGLVGVRSFRRRKVSRLRSVSEA